MRVWWENTRERRSERGPKQSLADGLRDAGSVALYSSRLSGNGRTIRARFGAHVAP